MFWLGSKGTSRLEAIENPRNPEDTRSIRSENMFTLPDEDLVEETAVPKVKSISKGHRSITFEEEMLLESVRERKTKA
jgi:hypothetical protein